MFRVLWNFHRVHAIKIGWADYSAIWSKGLKRSGSGVQCSKERVQKPLLVGRVMEIIMVRAIKLKILNVSISCENSLFQAQGESLSLSYIYMNYFGNEIRLVSLNLRRFGWKWAFFCKQKAKENREIGQSWIVIILFSKCWVISLKEIMRGVVTLTLRWETSVLCPEALKCAKIKIMELRVELDKGFSFLIISKDSQIYADHYFS